MSELRWHPMLGQWVAVATHRQDRTYFPPTESCPLCPTLPGGPQTEIPVPDFEIAVFENRFPSLVPDPPEPAIAGTMLVPVRPGYGACEVVVYTSDHKATLAELSLERMDQLVRVWAERTLELSLRNGISTVLVFENRGPEIGVTLTHPHGQIYAYPFLPPVLERELAMMHAFTEDAGRCMLCELMDGERADGRRIVAENDGWLAYIPPFARYPYEVHLTARRHCGNLLGLDPGEHFALGSIVQATVRAYDRLFSRPFPYIMAVHQRPAEGRPDAFHLHVEFYPPLRTATKLKYLAGSEAGAGMFINDTLAEEKAAELRAVW